MRNRPDFFTSPLSPILLSAIISSLIFMACSKHNSSAPVLRVQVRNNATLGNYLTDSKGNTLYFLTADIDKPSQCTGGCLTSWPAFYDSLISAATLPAGMNAADFGTIVAGNGQNQITFKGWPLYYFAPKDANSNHVQEQPGATGGDKVGNVWFAVKPDFSVLCGNKKVVNATRKDTIQKQFLVDSAGNTLYFFKKDSLKPDSLATNCTGGCIANWPVYYTPNAVGPSLLNKTDFGEITRNDGPGNTMRKQSTYKGRPLYYFTPDASQRGSVKGEGIGNSWLSVNPDVPPLR